jgi:hypothetical protein
MTSRSPLDVVKISKPCSLKWDELHGDEHKRFCPTCAKHVQNLSAMTQGDAETLLSSSQPGCITYERDTAGKVITLDYTSQPRARSRWSYLLMWIGIFAAAMQLLFGRHSPVQTTRTVGVIAPLPVPATTQPANGNGPGCSAQNMSSDSGHDADR